MKTFNEELKQHWIDVMQVHQDMDRIAQGLWVVDNRMPEGERSGCFFGCAMQSAHNTLERAGEAMHLPVWLVRLAEKIFEGLPEDDALEFPVRLLKAIPCDVDINNIKHKLSIIRLGTLPHRDQINTIIALHKRAISGDSPSREEWQRAYAAAADDADAATAYAAAADDADADADDDDADADADADAATATAYADADADADAATATAYADAATADADAATATAYADAATAYADAATAYAYTYVYATADAIADAVREFWRRESIVLIQELGAIS